MLTFLALLLLQVPGAPNGCATCYMNGWMDIPQATQVQTVEPGGTAGFAGWSYFCYDGQGADRIDAFWYDEAGFAHQILTPVRVYAFDRPDVRVAFQANCPSLKLSRANGFWVLLDYSQLPPGTHIIGINLWHGPYLFQPNGPWQPSFLRTLVVK